MTYWQLVYEKIKARDLRSLAKIKKSSDKGYFESTLLDCLEMAFVNNMDYDYLLSVARRLLGRRGERKFRILINFKYPTMIHQ